MGEPEITDERQEELFKLFQEWDVADTAEEARAMFRRGVGAVKTDGMIWPGKYCMGHTEDDYALLHGGIGETVHCSGCVTFKGEEGKLAPEIRISRHYTLPQSREGRGRARSEGLAFKDSGADDAAQWAAGELSDAGCTRRSRNVEYCTEEPKITDFSRGEEMTAVATLVGFTDKQLSTVARIVADG